MISKRSQIRSTGVRSPTISLSSSVAFLSLQSSDLVRNELPRTAHLTSLNYFLAPSSRFAHPSVDFRRVSASVRVGIVCVCERISGGVVTRSVRNVVDCGVC